jgi:hypothetical protein
MIADEHRRAAIYHADARPARVDASNSGRNRSVPVPREKNSARCTEQGS